MPFDRVPGWFQRYDAAHPGTSWEFSPDHVVAVSPDGSHVRIDVPFGPVDQLSLPGLTAHLRQPWLVGVFLVRRGGFAVARLRGAEVQESKIGRRHVQGKSKAGGWSQQRFARRRENQAQAAFDAAAGYVEQILLPYAPRLDLVASGGDRRAVDAVLGRRTLERLAGCRQAWLGGLPDPKRDVLMKAIAMSRSLTVEITDPPED